jgi:hypothetical protein
MIDTTKLLVDHPLTPFTGSFALCATRFSAALVNRTNYQTHTPSVHPTFACPTLF